MTADQEDGADQGGVRPDGWFASREALDAFQNWRRADCLECGARIVRARTAFVELLGTRDCSWIASLGRDPGALKANDAENIPAEDVFHFGYVHQSCEKAARESLAAGRIKLPNNLVRMRVGRGTSEDDAPRFDFHLPATAESCPFCGSTDDISGEHIYPLWFSRWAARQGATFSANGGPLRRLDFQVPVCSGCNNRWMSVLENDVQPILISMFDQNLRQLDPVVLSVAQQHRLALWATKTFFMLDLASGPLVPRGYLHALANQREPGSSVLIRIGRSHHSQGLRWNQKVMSIREGGTCESVGAHFSIFNVVFELFMHFSSGNITVIDRRRGTRLGKAMLPLWPANAGSLNWPPPFAITRIETGRFWSKVSVSVSRSSVGSATATGGPCQARAYRAPGIKQQTEGLRARRYARERSRNSTPGDGPAPGRSTLGTTIGIIRYAAPTARVPSRRANAAGTLSTLAVIR